MFNPVQQCLVGDASVGVVLHRVGQYHHGTQLVALSWEGFQIVQGVVHTGMEAGDGLIKGDGGYLFRQLPGGDILGNQREIIAEGGKDIPGVFAAGLGQRRPEGGHLLPEGRHGVGVVHQQQIRHGGSGLPDRLQLVVGGEGLVSQLRLRLGDGLVRAGQGHIGVQRVLIDKGPHQLRAAGGQRLPA